jgi:hypothetical protein
MSSYEVIPILVAKLIADDLVRQVFFLLAAIKRADLIILLSAVEVYNIESETFDSAFIRLFILFKTSDLASVRISGNII